MKYGLHILIVENFMKKFRGLSDSGWGNGYILVPPNHPYYGKFYDDIEVNVHGGLTYAKKFNSKNFLAWVDNREIGGDITLNNFEKFNNYWIIGFDTNHYGDSEYNCPKQYVLKETYNLLEQFLDDNNKEIKKYKYVYLRKDKLKKINEINSSIDDFESSSVLKK